MRGPAHAGTPQVYLSSAVVRRTRHQLRSARGVRSREAGKVDDGAAMLLSLIRLVALDVAAAPGVAVALGAADVSAGVLALLG